MFTIHLNKLTFFAHHGLHDEEAITGTNFEIDLSIKFDIPGNVTSIHQTINYTNVYEVVKKYGKAGGIARNVGAADYSRNLFAG